MSRRLVDARWIKSRMDAKDRRVQRELSKRVAPAKAANNVSGADPESDMRRTTAKGE